MKKITLWGYYGYGNFGDDLMLHNIVTKLKGKCTIKILTANRNLTDIDEEMGVKIYETYKGNKIKNFLLFVKVLLSTDFLVWGGGTCFSDEDGIVSPIYLILARCLNVKVIFSGIGISNINSRKNKYKMRIIAHFVNHIYVRDELSYNRGLEFFKTSQICVTEDLAYLFDFSIYFGRKRNELTVSLRNLDNYMNKSDSSVLYSNLANFVLKLLSDKEFESVNILPLDSTLDYDENHVFFESIRNVVGDDTPCRFTPCKTVMEKMDMVCTSELNISVRLHGIFISEISGSKTIGISYSDKIDTFMKSVKSKGCLTLEEGVKNPFLFDEIYKSLGMMFNIPNYSEMQINALKNLDFLKFDLE